MSEEVKIEGLFSAIMELQAVHGSRGGSFVIWKDLKTGLLHRMYGKTFNQMLKHEETQWVGHLMVDGGWLIRKLHRSDALVPIHPSDLIAKPKKSRRKKL